VLFVCDDWPSIICSRISLDVGREGAILEVNLPCIGVVNLVSFRVVLLFSVCGVRHVKVE
jgi:hypothetical protein